MARRIKEVNPNLKGKFFKLHVQVNNAWEKHKLYEDEVLSHFGSYINHIDVTARSKNEVDKNLKA